MVKKLFYIGLISLSFGLVHAADPGEQVIGPFGGLNNRDTSVTIPDNYAQDLLNVDVTPGGKSFKKRKGYGLSYALTYTTSPVHGVYDFFDANGNDIALSFNDSYMTSVTNGGTPSVLFSTGPLGATYQCIDSQGFAYCANGNRNAILKTNGATYSFVNVTTTGTIVALTPDRLVFSGFGVTAPNRIDFSASGDFTNYTVSTLPTSPFSFTITSPGSHVTHITYAFNRIMWFKDSSFGWILPGATAADWVVRTVSPLVGTLDNSSVYWQGILYFRGQDSNIYSYDGANLVKLSREISGTIAQTQNRSQNSWTQTTQADFASGFSTPTVYMDSITASNSLQLTFPDDFNAFRDGSNSSRTVWSSFCYGAPSACSTNVSVSNGNLVIGGSQTSGDSVVVNTDIFPPIDRGTTFYWSISDMFGTSSANSDFFVEFSSIYKVGANPANNNNYWEIGFESTNTAKLYLSFVKNSSDLIICSDKTSCNGTDVSSPVIAINLTKTNYSISMGTDTTSLRVIKAGTHTFPDYPLYVYNDYFFGAVNSGKTVSIDRFTVLPETATFQSAIHNAPSLNSWDTLNLTSQNNNGTNSFSIRSSGNTFSVNSSTPSWSSITSGSIPNVSTGTNGVYFQIKDDFGMTYSTGSSPKLDDFTQNWFEGSASDKSYMSYFNDSILFSVAYGAGATSNNRILKYDLLNQAWFIYDIPVNGFYLRNLSMYFGSATTGNVYKYGDTNNDAGSAINAYWKSKDFIGTDPFSNDELRNLSVYGMAVANSSVTVTYTLNEATSTSYTVPMYRSGATFFNSNRNLPNGINTNSFNIQVGNNAADQPFEIISERVGLNQKPWIPTNQ